ncbi:MAG: hypothetical protein DMNBKLKJ_00145 [Candidatus Westeberhardia cardiocondylae]|nr:hypothetical protein [Candidatus Westeberhardia cardiocondylae]
MLYVVLIFMFCLVLKGFLLKCFVILIDYYIKYGVIVITIRNIIINYWYNYEKKYSSKI